MSVGFPAKTDFADGGYLTATLLNDITGTLNLKRYSGETLLSTTSVTATSSISITSISQSYSHLRIVLDNLSTANTTTDLKLQFNTNTGSVYTYVYMTSRSSSITAGGPPTTSAYLIDQITASANVNNISGDIFIPRYSVATNTKTAKCTLSFKGAAGNYATSEGSIATTDTSAITSVQIFPTSGNFTAQGNIYIYGVA